MSNALTIVHIADIPQEGIAQRCSRCLAILISYQGCMECSITLDTKGRRLFWNPGSYVAVNKRRLVGGINPYVSVEMDHDAVESDERRCDASSST